MSKITRNDIENLFKKLDELDFQILFLFRRKGPRTRYDILVATKKGRKVPTIPRSTLYRRIDRLVCLGFLEVLKEERFESGRLKLKKPVLNLTMPKGFIASIVLSRDFKNLTMAAQEWIKWHNKYNIDFSEVKLNWHYFMMTLFFVMVEHPESFPNTDAQKMKKLVDNAAKITNKIFHDGFLEEYEARKKQTKDYFC